ncbi:hypothetical protein QA641_16245 [Bradyrhizobium sp. CB1650]|uniref:hypothetical protein n=1 Tax=Bradyrhizobium sp. CB1650 TaxID=3039153 RepID=UPI002435281C|nr:hypothetical protein [Bradyrhizobium sp. CB1650]WGD55283.1 hypothetical protein QA641_16245 [Bradyrhizobium sp. CB1650]
MVYAIGAHDRSIELSKLIELCGWHKAVQPPAREQNISGHRFGNACQRLDRVSYLIRCDQQMSHVFTFLRCAGVGKIRVAPFREFVGAAIVQPAFNRIDEG